MALCERCGRQTGDAAQFCLACSSLSGREQTGRRKAVQAIMASASYLRPFAPEGTQPAVLRSADEAAPWPAAFTQASQEPFRTAPSPQAPGGGYGGSRRRWVTAAAALVAILLCAAVAAIVLADHGKHDTGRQPAVQLPVSRPTAPTVAAGGVSELVTLAPGVAGTPDSAAVQRFVTRYFRAINDHDYAAYRVLFRTSLRSGLSAAAFITGYGSSADSRAMLRSIGRRAHGELAAVVTFTSRQQPANSPTRSSCTAWTISLYLVRQGRAYVLVSPPTGYRAAYTDC